MEGNYLHSTGNSLQETYANSKLLMKAKMLKNSLRLHDLTYAPTK